MAEEKKTGQDEFQFVQEKIKRPLLRQNRTLRKIGLTIVLAVLFGAVACVTFVLVYPLVQERFGEDPVREINIPKDEDPAEEVGEQEKSEEPAAPPVQEPAPPQEPIVITETVEMELEDYTHLMGKMRSASLEAMKSMVTVTAGSSDMDWFNETYESERNVSGLIVDDNGVEELILTTYSDISGADQLRVTFADSKVVEAALKKYDPVTDLAILSVNLGDLEESTLKQIRTVTWGNSRTLRPGEAVIALGSPVGIPGSLLFGNLTAVSYHASAVDGEYQLLLVDQLRSAHSNGVLINLKGEVVGWLQDTYLHSYNPEVLTAYGISDLKGVIEHLSNNQDIVYLGIRGADVTEEVQEELGLPEGVYITSVEMDSPAMTAGIQGGDVIVDISGQEVKSLSEMQELLLNFSEDQVITVKVMRQGKEGMKEIMCSVGLSALK